MSALKTWILSLGAVFLLAACSNDSANPGNIANAIDDASSASKSAGSADGKTIVKPGDKIVINGGKDTIVVADAEGSLYYSSGVFCWTDGCEAKLSSSSKGQFNDKVIQFFGKVFQFQRTAGSAYCDRQGYDGQP